MEFTAADRREEKFEQLLAEENPDDRMYVYWRFRGEKVLPALLSNVTPFADLFPFLQSEYGEQEYYVMIRRKKPMLWSGIIRIAQPLNFTPRKDIRLEIERLRRAQRKTRAPRRA